MAIEFIQSLPNDRPLLAYNNNIIRFKDSSEGTTINIPSDDPFGLPSPFVIKAYQAFLKINGVFLDPLYPSPDGLFYFNFKEYITALINTDNFKDNDFPIVATVINQTNKRYKQLNIELILYTDIGLEFEMPIGNDQTETTTYQVSSILINPFFLSGYSQITDHQNTKPSDNSFFVLTPFEKYSDKKAYVKYWEGYPFDISFYAPSENEISINGLSQPTFKINRFFISDGLNASHSQAGQSILIFNEKNNNQLTKVYELTINQVQTDCNAGHYLKWINRYGGWNYWLFDKGKKSITTKTIGSIKSKSENIEDTQSEFNNIGFNSQETIAVEDEFDKQDLMLISDLFESPKIYLYKNKPNTFGNYKDWLEVTIKDKTIITEVVKNDTVKISLEIQLPKRTTRTL